jgi:L-rhamnose mutarotase
MNLRTDVPDVVEKYRASHNEDFWPEMAAALEAHGAHNYAISVDPESLALFAYLEIEDEARWAAIADSDVCKRWWAFMEGFLAFNKDGKPAATDLTEVFFFDPSKAK